MLTEWYIPIYLLIPIFCQKPVLCSCVFKGSRLASKCTSYPVYFTHFAIRQYFVCFYKCVYSSRLLPTFLLGSSQQLPSNSQVGACYLLSKNRLTSFYSLSPSLCLSFSASTPFSTPLPMPPNKLYSILYPSYGWYARWGTPSHCTIPCSIKDIIGIIKHINAIVIEK